MDNDDSSGRPAENSSCDVVCDNINSGSANGALINGARQGQQLGHTSEVVTSVHDTNPSRGRSGIRSVPNRSRSLCNNQKNKKDLMTQLDLSRWSHLFPPRRGRSLDSRVNPLGDIAHTDISHLPASTSSPICTDSPLHESPSHAFEQNDDHLLPWGDQPTSIDTGKVLRIAYQNVAHSLSTRGADPGLPHFAENLIAAQCGVAVCSETNTNWRRHQYTHEVRRTLQVSSTVHISNACSIMGNDIAFRTRRFLPGGAAVFTFNHWACTVVESGQDDFGCGWFCYTTLQGRNKSRLTIVGFYRSNKPTSESGPITAHAQTMRVLESQKLQPRQDVKRVVNPREEMVKHMCQKIIGWQQRGDSIFISGDGNETPVDGILRTGTKRYSMSWLFEETGLTDVLRSFHSEPVGTTTTTPGRPIDWIGVWRVPILRVGRFEENFPAFSDHLGFFCDIDMAGLMAGAYDLLKLPKLRKLTLQNLPARLLYEEIVTQQWAIHHIAERASALHDRAMLGTFNTDDMASLNRLDTQITEILLGAEKRCSKKVIDRDKWSPRLQIGGRNILYWRARLHIFSDSSPRSKRILEAARKRALISVEEHESILSRNQVKQRLRESWKLHRNLQQQAAALRSQHLQNTAEALAATQQMTQEKAVKAIQKREQMRQRFARIRRANGKLKRGLIQIEVKDPITGDMVMLTDKESINNALLSRNEQHLQEPNHTPFGMLGELYDLVDPNNPNNQVEALLAGTAVLPDSYTNNVEVQQWVKNLQRKEIAELDLTVSSSDFVQYFSRRKEGTASSPSGRHYGHLKTFAKMEDATVRNTIIQIAATAVAMQQPLDRWLRCTQVMLDKGKGVYINNLRIIQLLEADLNFIIGFIWSKRLNQAANRADLFNTSQYALPGKTCNSAVLKKVLFFDLLRQTQQAGSIVDFDAKAAYDSIIPALATVTCMRMGLPRGAGNFMTQ